jgi:hypothetical protein
VPFAVEEVQGARLPGADQERAGVEAVDRDGVARHRPRQHALHRRGRPGGSDAGVARKNVEPLFGVDIERERAPQVLAAGVVQRGRRIAGERDPLDDAAVLVSTEDEESRREGLTT